MNGIKRILFVEDEEDQRELIRRAIAGSRYDFVIASSALEAVQLYFDCYPNSANRFHAIVFDGAMPAKDGFKVAEMVACWEDNEETKTRLASLSGYADIIDKTTLPEKLHVEREFKKPDDFINIRACIEEWLG